MSMLLGILHSPVCYLLEIDIFFIALITGMRSENITYFYFGLKPGAMFIRQISALKKLKFLLVDLFLIFLICTAVHLVSFLYIDTYVKLYESEITLSEIFLITLGI